MTEGEDEPRRLPPRGSLSGSSGSGSRGGAGPPAAAGRMPPQIGRMSHPETMTMQTPAKEGGSVRLALGNGIRYLVTKPIWR